MLVSFPQGWLPYYQNILGRNRQQNKNKRQQKNVKKEKRKTFQREREKQVGLEEV